MSFFYGSLSEGYIPALCRLMPTRTSKILIIKRDLPPDISSCTSSLAVMANWLLQPVLQHDCPRTDQSRPAKHQEYNTALSHQFREGISTPRVCSVHVNSSLASARVCVCVCVCVSADPADLSAFRKARSAARTAVRTAKCVWLQRKADMAQSGKFSGERVWSAIRDIHRCYNGMKPVASHSILKSDGTLCTSVEEERVCWQQHSTRVLNVISVFDVSVFQQLVLPGG